MSILTKALELLKPEQPGQQITPLQPHPWTQEPPNKPDPVELAEKIKSFPFWYQRIYLGEGIYTMGSSPAYHEYVWSAACQALPTDLNGASVLDIGTNAGYFAIQSKLMGGGRIVGIEAIDDYFQQAELCRSIWDLDIEYLPMDAHSVGTLDEQFDIVVFTGILYHLKNPLQVIEDLGKLCKDTIIVETEVIPENPNNRIFMRQGATGKHKVTETTTGFMKFIERDELNGDGSNWWVPDTECVLGMLRTAGFTVNSKPIYPGDGRVFVIASKSNDTICNLNAFDSMA